MRCPAVDVQPHSHIARQGKQAVGAERRFHWWPSIPTALEGTATSFLRRFVCVSAVITVVGPGPWLVHGVGLGA